MLTRSLQTGCSKRKYSRAIINDSDVYIYIYIYICLCFEEHTGLTHEAFHNEKDLDCCSKVLFTYKQCVYKQCVYKQCVYKQCVASLVKLLLDIFSMYYFIVAWYPVFVGDATVMRLGFELFSVASPMCTGAGNASPQVAKKLRAYCEVVNMLIFFSCEHVVTLCVQRYYGILDQP